MALTIREVAKEVNIPEYSVKSMVRTYNLGKINGQHTNSIKILNENEIEFIKKLSFLTIQIKNTKDLLKSLIEEKKELIKNNN